MRLEGPKASLDDVEIREILPLPGPELRPLGRAKPVANNYNLVGCKITSAVGVQKKGIHHSVNI
jgi:hypothetical protein